MRVGTRLSRHSVRWSSGMASLVSLMITVGAATAEHGPMGKPAVDPKVISYTAAREVSGTLKLAGSDTMQTILSRLGKEFRRYHPGAILSIEGGGSSAAVKEFVNTPPRSKPVSQSNSDEPILLVASSRVLSTSEVKQFTSKRGYPPTALPVAVDAVGFYVHRDNPVPHLTLEQVDAMFSTTRHRGYPQQLTRWGQLGVNNGWEAMSINLYGRDQKSGTRAFIKEQVLEHGEFTLAVHEEPGAASVILALSRDPFAIGYSGIGLQASTVRAVPLAEKEGMPYVLPSAETVLNESYPLRRFLYLYADKSPNAPLPPLAEEFLAFVNSREGQQAVIKAGFYPLPAKEVQQSLAALTVPNDR